MRYLLSKEDSQNILKDLINSVRIDAGQEGFEEVTILNTFNLKESINGKETYVFVLPAFSDMLNGFKISTDTKVAKFESIIIALMKLNNKSSSPFKPKK